MGRRFLLNLPIPAVADLVVFHGGDGIDFPAVVFRVAAYPSIERPEPAALDLRILAMDGDGFLEAVEFGPGIPGRWSRPVRPEPVQLVVEVADGEDPPGLPDAPGWYRELFAPSPPVEAAP